MNLPPDASLDDLLSDSLAYFTSQYQDLKKEALARLDCPEIADFIAEFREQLWQDSQTWPAIYSPYENRSAAYFFGQLKHDNLFDVYPEKRGRLCYPGTDRSEVVDEGTNSSIDKLTKQFTSTFRYEVHDIILRRLYQAFYKVYWFRYKASAHNAEFMFSHQWRQAYTEEELAPARRYWACAGRRSPNFRFVNDFVDGTYDYATTTPAELMILGNGDTLAEWTARSLHGRTSRITDDELKAYLATQSTAQFKYLERTPLSIAEALILHDVQLPATFLRWTSGSLMFTTDVHDYGGRYQIQPPSPKTDAEAEGLVALLSGVAQIAKRKRLPMKNVIRDVSRYWHDPNNAFRDDLSFHNAENPFELMKANLELGSFLNS